MTRLQETIETPFPLEQAFRYTSDFSNIEQWDPGVAKSEKLTDGPVGVGTVFNLLVKTGPLTTAMEYTVTHFDPPHRVVMEGSGDSIHAVDDIRFTASGDATRIDYTADITLSGAAGLAEPFVKGVLDRVGKKAMAALKEALSTEPAPPGDSFIRNLLDRLVLPGAFGFTRYGYESRKRGWNALPNTLQGRTAVVTGATSGLGRVTAEKLANLGARVVLVGRSREKLDLALEQIAKVTANHDLAGEQADLSLLSETRQLAQRLLTAEAAIHILINNAAVLPNERSLTKEGFETAFATDLLSPYLLTSLLIPAMRASAQARIVNVLSGGMYLSGVDVDDLENMRGRYDGSRAYARAKRALMILTEHWSAALADSGVVVNAMHPGWADTPGVRDSLPGFHKLTRSILRTPEQGADTIVWLAAAAEAGRVSGKFWLDREPHLSAIIPGTAGSRTQRRELLEKLSRLVA